MIEKKTIGHRVVNLIFGIILVILACSCFLPLLYNLAVSLSSKAAAEAGLVSFWPVDFTFGAYQEIMGEKASSYLSGLRSKELWWRLSLRFRC